MTMHRFDKRSILMWVTVVAVTGACAHGTPPGTPSASPIDAVAVLPFVPTKVPGAQPDISLVPVMAEVDGHRGVFSLDLGSPWTWVCKDFMQPKAGDGIDTTVDDGVLVHGQLRIGPLLDPFEDTTLRYMVARPVRNAVSHPVNVEISSDAMEDYRYAGGPVAGNIGLSALEPFETIADYVHRQVVLIRLDAAGHRLAEVPAYTPAWSAPLVDVRQGSVVNHYWGVRVRLNGVTTTWIIDTGTQENMVNTDSLHLPDGQTDTDSLFIADRHFHATVLKLKDLPATLLGSDFLSSLGKVGFNHHTHQFLVYR
jgi:hypothetical protein